MLRDYWTTVKHSAIYGLGMVSYRLVGFLLLPLYTHKIPVAQYGLYGAIEVLSQLLVGVLSLGLPTALFKWLADFPERDDRRSAVATSVFLLGAANAMVLSLIGIVAFRSIDWFAARFPDAGLTPAQYRILIAAFCGDVFLTGIVRLQLNLLRAEGKPGWYSAVSLFRFVLVIAVTIYFVGELDLGIAGIYLGLVTGSAVVVLALFAYLMARMSLRFRLAWVLPMLAYGIPLSLVSINLLLLNLGNRFFVEHFCSLGELGRYTLGQKIGSVVSVLLVQPFTFAYFPLMWKLRDSNPDFVRKATTYFSFVGAWALLAFILFRREFTVMLAKNPQYLDAYRIVPLIAFANVAYGLVYLLQSPFYLSGRTSWIAISFSLGLVCNVAFNLWAVPRWGSEAAAFSIGLSYFLIAVISYPMGRKCLKIDYELGKVALALCLAVAFGAGGLVGFPGLGIAALLGKAVVFAAFPAVVIYTGLLEAEEKRALRKAIGQALAR